MGATARRASKCPKLTVVTRSIDPLEESSDYKLRPMRLEGTKLPHLQRQQLQPMPYGRLFEAHHSPTIDSSSRKLVT